MKIQSLSQSSCQPIRMRQNKNVGFGATPNQILKAVDEAAVCMGKKNFLASIGEYFNEFQKVMTKMKDAPEEFIYKLGEKNNIPDSLKNSEVNGLTLAKLDDSLNENTFKCSPTSTCGCGIGRSKGTLARDLFQKIGVEEPNIIRISK